MLLFKKAYLYILYAYKKKFFFPALLLQLLIFQKKISLFFYFFFEIQNFFLFLMSSFFSHSSPVVIVHYTSGCTLTVYAVSMMYRLGVLKRILRRSVYDRIERKVEHIKSKTEPMVSSPNRLLLLRSHLLRSYSYTCAGVVFLTMGALSFVVCPKVPLIYFIGSALTSGLLLAAVPKTVVSPTTRFFLFLFCWFSSGYTLGPLGWVAQDSLAAYFLVTSSALLGVTTALFLTRGIISYLLSAQIFSFALSIFVGTSSKSTATLFGVLKSHPGAQRILNLDITALFAMQLATNLTIQMFHTLPQIRKYVSSKKSDAVLQEEADPLADAHTLCTGWAYVGYRVVRGAFYQVLKYLNGKGSDRSTVLFMREEGSKGLNILSSISSGIIMGATYVRLITRLQNQGDMESSMNSMRQLFQNLSSHRHAFRKV